MVFSLFLGANDLDRTPPSRRRSFNERIRKFYLHIISIDGIKFIMYIYTVIVTVTLLYYNITIKRLFLPTITVINLFHELLQHKFLSADVCTKYLLFFLLIK